MDVREKLSILADAAKYDASCASSGSKGRAARAGGIGSTEGMGICHSFTPDGRCVSLLKILLTNYCLYDCQYCVNRLSSDTPRARFTPEEVVRLTIEFYRRNYIEGLFLSSGIIQSPNYTMEEVVRVARCLRTKHGFQGYIHLKTIAGASDRLIAEAGRWADRLSVNVELPTEPDLVQLAPEKNRREIEASMSEIKERVDEGVADRTVFAHAAKYAPAGQSTQMIIGASPSSDRAILDTASGLYERFHLRRVYYSAYSPIPHADPRLPVAEPPLLREHRLYQADWLLRYYGFAVDELTPVEEPALPMDVDPKLAWALRNRDQFPVDVNKAPRELLLRVPGLGVRNVDRILKLRRHRAIRWADLKRLRLSLKRAKFFLTAADRNPDVLKMDHARLQTQFTSSSRQLLLFETSLSARTGEL